MEDNIGNACDGLLVIPSRDFSSSTGDKDDEYESEWDRRYMRRITTLDMGESGSQMHFGEREYPIFDREVWAALHNGYYPGHMQDAKRNGKNKKQEIHVQKLRDDLDI
ncbi:MAG: hypothetical protein CL912_21620 [Deltaproteobacteria bacterium]|nr:hypothetical protein [Deltaproteobacteria bacterium]